uniref:Cytochrome b5 heme-binding domain-containing protein n=1 Tax=Attheya septentrionalis TaxID=420275 RepID=A0A7S2U5A0_9STRA|mmetsp:Transcript_11125/g.20305  ORF Transcript_11125/g.20305 Transcript_11125/m.20305 type:complete len:124 (+) Transcript_11125:3-374(+)
MEEVAKHTSEKDCWLIIGNMNNGGPKVYDITSYLDDHPGGAEVMLDVSGQDGDEFFEDIGHSNDAREELKKYLIGTLKVDEATLARNLELAKRKQEGAGGSGQMMVLLIAILALIIGYYKTQM